MSNQGYIPCCERVFPLSLASWLPSMYSIRMHWLRYLLGRLGREAALRVWEQAYAESDDEWLRQILSAGWEAVEAADPSPEQEMASAVARLFPAPVEGVSAEEARGLVDRTPPFCQVRQHLPGLLVEREIGTYEALRLLYDGLARLAEALIDQHSKRGELIAYEAMLADLAQDPPPQTPVAEFLAQRWTRFSTPPERADMHSAGLQVELVRGSESEVVTRVIECEWARYYRQHHPRVGYLLACSLDHAVYQAFNDRLWLQRTTTLMEGGSYCDFRVYAVAPGDAPAAG